MYVYVHVAMHYSHMFSTEIWLRITKSSELILKGVRMKCLEQKK